MLIFVHDIVFGTWNITFGKLIEMLMDRLINKIYDTIVLISNFVKYLHPVPSKSVTKYYDII